MPDFLTQFRGKFTSTLNWADLDKLWETITSQNQAWYLYAIDEIPPQRPASPDQLKLFIERIDKLLHDEHQEDYCGIVYADDLQQPSLVKIYDPNNLGVVCGFSDSPPLPGWVISTTKPVDLPSAFPPPGNRRRWWQNLFKFGS